MSEVARFFAEVHENIDGLRERDGRKEPLKANRD